jgi:phage terminase large subunit-like protein
MVLPRGTAQRVLAELFPVDWQPEGEQLLPHQVAPGWEWDVWVLMGGRGSGKTKAGATWMAARARRYPGMRGRIIGPTLGDVFESCVEGPSGLQATDPEVAVKPGARGGSKIVWPNGSEALLLGTHSPNDVERLRASGNRHFDWWEEAAANRQFKPAWNQADFGLRLGAHPQSIVTTTPRNVPMLRELLEQPGTAVTHGTISDNPHLPEGKKQRLLARYAGTRLGRQELGGELLTDVPGALWTGEMIELAHTSMPSTVPDMARVVVAIDPATTSGDDSDDTGIIAAGKGIDGRGYVLADRTCHLSPKGWALRAIQLFDDLSADRIVGEANNGGDMIEQVIRGQRPNIPYKKVTASRGKAVRAEPAAALYEQGKVSHVDVFPELEDQMMTWDPESGESPDRVDALVWALADLGFYSQRKEWRIG